MELLFRGARLSVPGAFEREGHDGERGIYPLLRAHRVEVIAIGLRAAQTQFAALVEVAEQRDVRPADRLAVLALPRQLGGHCEQIGGSGIFRDLLAQRLPRLGLLRRLLAKLKPSHELRRPENRGPRQSNKEQSLKTQAHSPAARLWRAGRRPAEQFPQQPSKEFLHVPDPTRYRRFALFFGLVFGAGENVADPGALIL